IYTVLYAGAILVAHYLNDYSSTRITAIVLLFIFTSHIAMPVYAGYLLPAAMILILGETFIMFSSDPGNLGLDKLAILVVYIFAELMSVLASVGTAGVPGVGLIMLSMVFAQVGLPVEGIALVIGVDRLMDMIRTSVNVSGDAVVSSIVAKWEGKLNPEVFNDEHAGAMNVETDAHIAQK
ncbi:MAG: cation:dicarboxylase symporter family transporter, partial [Methylococcales bacterium]|nr:cation:dicarboxylase symporter family transporter [Methylococcales bacterium]